MFDIPENEADMLSIYFEETARYQAIEQRNRANNNSSARSGDGWYSEYEIEDEEVEYDDGE